MKCTPRELEDGETLPTIKNTFIRLDANGIYECDQPELLNDQEFNLIVEVHKENKAVYIMRSIDFDFLEETK